MGQRYEPTRVRAVGSASVYCAISTSTGVLGKKRMTSCSSEIHIRTKRNKWKRGLHIFSAVQNGHVKRQ